MTLFVLSHISLILLFTDHFQLYQSCGTLTLTQTQYSLLLLLHTKAYHLQTNRVVFCEEYGKCNVFVTKL